MSALVSCTSRFTSLALAAAMLVILSAGPTMAQGADPNPGSITLTTSIDFPSVYYFRGIRQEIDPRVTMFPYGDVGIALFSGDGRVKSASVNFGVWNSLHTGTSGSGAGGPGPMHYEEDFYSTLTLGLAGAMSIGTTFTAYTSPNSVFRTVKEISFKVAQASKYAPYGLVAFELGGMDGALPPAQADGGAKRGTYLELGAAPSWPFAAGKATLAVPVKVGLSLKDYYEGPSGDETFGYFDLGVLATVPLTGIPSNYGAWNVHAGVDYLRLGDSTVTVPGNDLENNRALFSVGIGMTY